MLCSTCEAIPLDLFLPMRACGQSSNGYAFITYYQHYEGPTAHRALEASAGSGCHLCAVILAALNVAEPVGAIATRPSHWDRRLLRVPGNRKTRRTRDSDVSGISLEVYAEGEMIVSDGEIENLLWWYSEGIGQGKGLGKKPGKRISYTWSCLVIM
jgi:hypothetical protein